MFGHEVLMKFLSPLSPLTFEAGLVFRVMIRLGPHRRAPGHGKGADVICSEPLLPRRGPVLPGSHWKLESAAIPGYLQGALVEETWKRLETWRFGQAILSAPSTRWYLLYPAVFCCHGPQIFDTLYNLFLDMFQDICRHEMARKELNWMFT